MIRIILMFIIMVTLNSCYFFTIRSVDYSWKLEHVLAVNHNGFIQKVPYLPYFSVKEIFEMENVTLRFNETKLRLIRDRDGDYYMVARGFSNIYIFRPSEGELKLISKYQLAAKATTPAFNSRNGIIHYLDGTTSPKIVEK